ncbi:MAG: tRNA (adenosine(37)-N6)-threonylcarbamoyltransferase complex dimerization subunit type 1 TsaB [Aggregatilineales bacterium]
MLLALDTATDYMSLALHDGTSLIAEQSLRTGRRQNTLLAGAIEQMMQVCKIDMADLTALAVATGPGSYTGLRVGVALAKGMAGIGNLPLVGMSTLDILAAGQPFQNTRYELLAILQAGRTRIIAGRYRVKKGRWQSDETPVITDWDTLLKDLEGSFYVTGEIDSTGHEVLEAAQQRETLSLTVMPGAYRARRAGFLAQEAWRQLTDADDDFSADKIMPVYLKSPGGV